MKTGKLFLIPSSIGDDAGTHQFPIWNTEIIQSLKYYFVENPKPARAFIKSIDQEVAFDQITLFHFDKHAKDNSALYLEVISCLKNGNDVGVLSDSGCPGIADPGSELVKMAHEKNIEIIPLVGPSSIFLTLMASGLNGQNFHFIGYLPKDQKERVDQIKKLSAGMKLANTTYIFIETPYRAEVTFKELLQHLAGSSRVCLGIDIFSPNQEIITHTVDGWNQLKTKPGLKDRQVVFALGS